MIQFIDAAISRKRTTLLMMAVIVLCGLIARATLPIANDPHIVLPYFYIGIPHEGISPEDAERLLVQPMEIELRKIEGIEEITGLASEGHATLFVEFDADYDLDAALIDVREAVDRGKSEIPATAEEPIVRELDVDDFPLIQINLLSNGASERQVYAAALDLRDDIEAIPSVLSADLQGHREEVLEVLIDPQALEAYAISSEALVSVLSRNNRLIPAGSIDTGSGRFSVKVPSVVEEAADVMDLPIAQSGDAVVTLGDVSDIRRTFKDRTGYARFNGRETIAVTVKKRADANVIDTANAVLAVVEEVRARTPSSIDILPSQNTAEFAETQVTELQGNIMTALALVMVLVVAAMGFRSGVIVGLGIPVSLLFSVIIIYLLGYTFNFMVMFGMLLGLGMLIDGAIVVTEYADRKMSEGLDHAQAYSEAVKRMFWPVTASTATTLAAFLPLIFWPGISGQFMRYLPVTVFTVLSGSLLYALLFGPVLGSIFGRPTAHSAASQATLEQLEHGDPTRLGGATGCLCAPAAARLSPPAAQRRPDLLSPDQCFPGLRPVWPRHGVLQRRGSPVCHRVGQCPRQPVRSGDRQAGARGGAAGAARGGHTLREYADDHARGRRPRPGRIRRQRSRRLPVHRTPAGERTRPQWLCGDTRAARTYA
jgi:multidrug efflux pump